jgi:S1-C subfamily serine protease
MYNASSPRFVRAIPLMLWALLAAWLSLHLPPLTAQSGFNLARTQQATVLIMQARQIEDRIVITCVGSGTLVSRTGLILTNAHHVVTGQNCPGDQLIIALSTQLDAPPLPRFQAEIVSANAGLDLALLRIVRQNDGRVIDPDTLALPFVGLGDSEAMRLDSTVTAIGYPGIGEEPVTAEVGTLIGFAAEPSVAGTSWFKTSANARGVMAGGGAYNAAGELIGVITTAPVQRDAPGASCITIQDTNFDNAINNLDDCIVVGGPINVLRPSNFAEPLLRAASLGLAVSSPDIVLPRIVDTRAPAFEYLGFAPSVNPAGMPTTIIRSLPAGSTSLYLFFDYANMTPETVYELRVTIDGIASPQLSLSPVRWSGGRQGLWYIGTIGQPLANGVYEFAMFLDGTPAGNARIVVGAPPEAAPQFSDLVFGLLNAEGRPIGNGFVLPTGPTASAQFLYRNMTVGLSWTFIWYYEGQEVQRSDAGLTWLESDGPEGAKTISIQDPNGLLPGRYRLILYIDGRIASVSDFTLAGAPDGASSAIFLDQHFTSAASVNAARTAPAISSFAAGVSTLYAVFDWQRIAPGTLWQMRWTVDDDPFYTETLTWNAAENGEQLLLALSAPGGLPDGTYRLDLLVDQLLFSSAEARVGIGQLPIDRFSLATGVQMRGRIIDAVSGEGIVGASVFIVSEDFSVADFTRDWNQSQLFAQSITDGQGRFEIERLLQRDAPYSVVIWAEGYLPITADGVELNEDTYPDLSNPPIEVEFAMMRGA